MIPKHQELLKELSKTNYGVALKEYLSEHLEKLDTVKNTRDWEDVQSRKYAIEFIEKLFRFMDISTTESSKRNQYK